MSDCRVPMPVYEKPCPYCRSGERIATEVDGEGYMRIEVDDGEYAALNVYRYSPGSEEDMWVGCFDITNCPMCGRSLGGSESGSL